MKPKCVHCEKKPVRKLASLPGGYGRAEYFCSLACAAKHGLDGPMDLMSNWCEKHKLWWDGTEYEECWECDSERRKLEEKCEQLRAKQMKEATLDG